jgi:hypothetical protein
MIWEWESLTNLVVLLNLKDKKFKLSLKTSESLEAFGGFFNFYTTTE